MKRFLFICTGNTCRSPLAQALLKEKRPDLEVKSAGVNALPGMDASEGTLSVLKEKGIELQHSSSQVDEELMDWADIVLTLTTSHKNVLIKQFPHFVDKINTLKEYAYVDDEETNKYLQLLQHHYAELELKQAQFLADHKEKIEQLNKRSDVDAKNELNDLAIQLQNLIKEDRREIERLEMKIPTCDISDPFGGNTDIYRKTADEIEKAIKKMIEKI